MKIWIWVDRVYRWLFRHAIAIGIVLIAQLAFWMSIPTCIEDGERWRAKASRMHSDFRTVKQQLATAAQTTSNTEVIIPIDAFSEQPAAARMAVTSGTLIIFSVGPDKISNEGKIFYDATNGITSQGDVITTLAEGLSYSVL